MTRRKGTASGPVRRGGGAGQRVKQFAVERGIRVPATLAEIIAPDTPATPYSVGAAVADGLVGPDAARGASKRSASKAASKTTRAALPKGAAARKTPAKPPGKSGRRKSR